MLVLANGAPAAGMRIWGHVLVLANGSEEELGFCVVRNAACARARKESPGKRKCARARSHLGCFPALRITEAAARGTAYSRVADVTADAQVGGAIRPAID